MKEQEQEKKEQEKQEQEKQEQEQEKQEQEKQEQEQVTIPCMQLRVEESRRRDERLEVSRARST
eukprot:768529-Hanusia_phi.AAC.4